MHKEIKEVLRWHFAGQDYESPEEAERAVAMADLRLVLEEMALEPEVRAQLIGWLQTGTARKVDRLTSILQRML